MLRISGRAILFVGGLKMSPKRERDYMALTPTERRVVAKNIVDDLRRAIDAKSGEMACHWLEHAQDELHRIIRRQWWSTR
jgi:hypothetical protein